MTIIVLSGTDPIVLSGTKLSCYRGPKWGITHCPATVHASPNCTNIESFGFFLTAYPEIQAVDNHRRIASANLIGARDRKKFAVLEISPIPQLSQQRAWRGEVERRLELTKHSRNTLHPCAIEAGEEGLRVIHVETFAPSLGIKADGAAR